METLLDYYQNPRNRGKLDSADTVVSGGNPGCGDVVTMYIEVDDDIVRQVSFEGQGCTISQAGASMMAELAEGKTVPELCDMGADEIIDLMGREVVMSRLRCATIGLGTIQAGLTEIREQRLQAEHEATC
ncbi:MAG: SUF system NifU family Fe-S cluster assembly protein [Chloroflexi bacterium]|nr:SUF system NifU family Fe-S cluster assembly protein [Chloroflexota bacterium]